MMATNTAIAIMEQTGQSVVMVDADYVAPALDVMLNLEGDRNINTLLARASRLDRDLVSSVLANHTSGLRTPGAAAHIWHAGNQPAPSRADCVTVAHDV